MPIIIICIDTIILVYIYIIILYWNIMQRYIPAWCVWTPVYTDSDEDDHNNNKIIR